eukprot:4361559-Pyramimonas_sp.AAC.1
MRLVQLRGPCDEVGCPLCPVEDGGWAHCLEILFARQAPTADQEGEECQIPPVSLDCTVGR